MVSIVSYIVLLESKRVKNEIASATILINSSYSYKVLRIYEPDSNNSLISLAFLMIF